MHVLLVDTAGPVVGVAAFADGVLLGAASARVPTGTEGWLGEQVAALLPLLPRLDQVAVAIGPGAFTGVRVGVSVALGLGLARNVPLVPVSSLALRACLAPGHPRVLVLLDAKKSRVYAGVFDTRSGVPVALDDEADVPPEQAAATAPALVVGEGALVYPQVLTSAGHALLDAPDRSPVAFAGAFLAASSAYAADGVGPRYLRAPDAQPRQV